jgi:GDP-L-fucose synthase
MFDLVGKKIWIPGARGMLGSALVRRLVSEKCQLVTTDRQQLDLRNQAATNAFVQETKPDAVLLCAATVGGIRANMERPAAFIYDNAMIEMNIIEAAHRNDVSKVVFFGSSCMYPRLAEQPIREDSLMTGPLEPTNEAYALAKLAGLAMIQSYRRQYGRSYISIIPTNLYGPNDHFFDNDGHVIAAMINRYHRAKTAGGIAEPIWGSGNVFREFLYVDDAADAITHLMQSYDSDEPINVAGGEVVSILELARIIAKIIGYTGQITCDTSKPDGAPRKGLNSEKLAKSGWVPKTSLHQGLEKTYADYLARMHQMNEKRS